MKATLPLIASILIGCIPSCNRNTPTSENDKAYAMLEQTAAFNAAEQYDSAIAQGKKALALTGVADSTAGYLYAEMSVSYSMKGNMKQSLAYGQKGHAIQPGGNIAPESFAILCGNMGISYRRMGMNDSAAVCYQRGIQEALKSSSKGSIGLFAKQPVGALLRNGPSQRKFELCPESHSKCKPSRRHHRNAFGYGQRRHLLCLQTGFKTKRPNCCRLYIQRPTVWISHRSSSK